MYTKHIGIIAVPITVILLSTTILPLLPLVAQEPNEPEVIEPDVAILYSGGEAIGKRAKTQTTGSVFTTDNLWLTLPNSTLSWNIPALRSDLLNVAFSAECSKTGGGIGYIRILDTADGVALQPYSSTDFQPFCSASTRATHKGNWVRRPALLTFGRIHNLVVQFRQNIGTLTIDNWTFELVAYN